jgi:hypothetical protein
MNEQRIRYQLPMTTALVCAAILAAAIGGCTPHKDRTELLKGVRTEEVRLESKHTGGPTIVMPVPEGFGLDWTEDARHDNFILYDPKDTSTVQRGMIIVNITPFFVQHGDTGEADRSIGKIAGAELEWRETVMPILEGADTVFQREAVQKELLKGYPSPDKNGPLLLHVFVVGSDPKLVEMLMGCVESMKILPGKPNI